MNKNELVLDRQMPVYYNYSDLERVRQHIVYVGSLTDGVYVWSNNIVLDINDMQSLYQNFSTMLQDLQTLRDNNIIKSTTPQVPTIDRFDYIKANAVEQILYDIEYILDKISSQKINYVSNNTMFNEISINEVEILPI